MFLLVTNLVEVFTVILCACEIQVLISTKDVGLQHS